jgi:hypothetical protein
VKPKGFRVKSKLKLKKTCDVRPAEGSKLESGLVHVSGSGQGQGLGSDLSYSDPVSDFDPGSGPISVSVSGSPPFGYVYEFISPPLPDQISPVKGAGVSPAKQLDEGLLGATCLVPAVVAVGSVSPVEDQNADKAVRHSFPVKGMLRRGFLGSLLLLPHLLLWPPVAPLRPVLPLRW